MSKGYFAIVQNGTHDYVRMAYALAMSIASTQKSVRKLSIAIDTVSYTHLTLPTKA